MKKLYEIIHGSEDSLDIDVYWVCDTIPNKQELMELNEKHGSNDINCITIDNGVVTDCIKGVVDEVNNGILDTFSLHTQSISECPIKHRLDRDFIVKFIRFTRGILLQFSKTEHRPICKQASRSHNLSLRIETCLKLIDQLLNVEDFVRINKTELYKFLTFQLAQSSGLLTDQEIYTKQGSIKLLPDLSEFINREGYSKDKEILLQKKIKDFLLEVQIKFKAEYIEEDNIIISKLTKKVFDVKYEKYLENAMYA